MYIGIFAGFLGLVGMLDMAAYGPV